uniref:Lipocalin n=1 Tax=Rhipicephalus appendiculatus TaxID=34631 RepID=A0A131YTN4_RHIAP
MYHVLLAILFPFLVSSQDAPRVFLKMWHLYDLLNTTNKIWILSTSQPALYENEEVTCINYRAKNLTTRSVTSIYQVVWKEEVHRGIMVKARLLDYRYPSMTRRDWNGDEYKMPLLDHLHSLIPIWRSQALKMTHRHIKDILSAVYHPASA